MVIVITGFAGFVSRHFLDYIKSDGISIDIIGLDVNKPRFDYKIYKTGNLMEFRQVNLLDVNSVKDALIENKPDYILHLQHR